MSFVIITWLFIYNLIPILSTSKYFNYYARFHLKSKLYTHWITTTIAKMSNYMEQVVVFDDAFDIMQTMLIKSWCWTCSSKLKWPAVRPAPPSLRPDSACPGNWHVDWSCTSPKSFNYKVPTVPLFTISSQYHLYSMHSNKRT